MNNYLYNGMELPALPNWDKALYPYVYISNGFFGIGREFVCFQNIEYGVNDSGYYCLVIPAGTGMSGLYSDGQWKTPTVTTTDTRITIPNDAFVWANFDVLNEDGSVYLAASEPVPILAPILAPTLDPLSLWLGWKAGNWVARQRGKKKPATGVYDDTMPIEWKMQDVANNPKIPWEAYQIYSYNGLEFGRPDIEADSDYKYHLIEKYSSGYHYWCLKQPFVYVNEDKEYAKIEGGYNYSLYICKTGETGFVHHDDISGDNLKLNWENIIWTNTDICDADGTVRMAATEPVYVREQVAQELIKVSNYIPTDEMINNHAISIQSDGDEVVLSSPYAAILDDEGNIVVVLFMDFEVGLVVFMFYFKQEIIAEGQAVEPGLYYVDSIPSMYPPDTKFKFYIPDEM